ncbi:MAG: hypothetical protein AAF791_01475 [Bacteroidota bacterium]
MPRADGSWSYPADDEGNRIPDFSYAGYRNGEPIPNLADVPVLRVDGPSNDDPTAGIQAAINEVGEWTRDERGFRGIIELAPGLYRLREPIEISYSGVVVRGTGRSADPRVGTVLVATKNLWNVQPRPFAPVTIGRMNGPGGYGWVSWTQALEGPAVEVTTPFVQVGSRELDVQDPEPFDVGMAVVVERRCTERWLEAIDRGGVDIRGEAAPNTFWRCEANGRRELDAAHFRRIERIEGQSLILDAPLYDHIDRSLTPATVRRVSEAYIDLKGNAPNGLVRNVGLENLRVVHEVDTTKVSRSEAHGGWAFLVDEEHPAGGIIFRMVEDAWARDLTLSRWRDYGVGSRVATRITIDRVAAVDPVAQVQGGRRYGVSIGSWSQLVLIRDGIAQRCRHGFTVNGGITSSGVAFVRPTSYLALAEDGAHRAWASGILYDNLRHVQPWTDIPVAVYSLVHWGSDRRTDAYSPGHGWAGVHQVVWNAEVGESPVFGGRPHVRIGDPPRAQNYLIGYTDARTGTRPAVSSGHGPPARPNPVGYVEDQPGRLYPVSLYEAQRAARR